jgi:hypothetical protein
MKESEITPEIIQLSKEVAEYWRMEIEPGHWVYLECPDTDTVLWLVGATDIFKERELELESHGTRECAYIMPEEATLIPSISDCLEKLEGLFGIIQIAINYPKKGGAVIVFDDDCEGMHGFFGDTLHEALLSTLLEILKQNKSEVLRKEKSDE